jgi:zinc protease
MAGSMLMRGTQRLDRQELTDEWNRLKARAGIGGGIYSAGGGVQTTRANLPAVLRLVGEVLKTPAFDADQFAELKQQTIAGYERNRSDPRALGALALTRQLNPLEKGHPLYARSFEEAIADTEALELREVTEFHESFYGANNGRMAIVGDFDPREIEPIVESMFGDWGSPQYFRRVANPHQETVQKKIVVNTPDKPNAYFAAGLGLPIRDDHEDYPALVLANFMIGGGFLNSRLASRIRQKDGLSYGVASQFSAHPIDLSGLFRAYAIYAPENADKLETAFIEEIERAVKEGFTDDEVSDAKSGYVQYRNNMRSNDSTLASMLSQNLYLDRTMAWTEDLEKKIGDLTPQEIKSALQRHIVPGRISIVIAGDFDE